VSAINFHTKEISVKIVYYGPGLCGKTTSLQAIYRALPEDRKNQFVSLATEVDRTIFFDFLPVTAYRIRDFAVRLQLYTVPGQVFYNATRKLVLNGVDGLVFVVDSQRAMIDSNTESLQNLQENLTDLGMEIEHIPMVLQANKRDLDDIFSLEEMDQLFNERHVPFFGTIATTGDGVMEALRTVSQLVVNNLVRKGLGRQLHEENANVSARPVTDRPSLNLSAMVAAAAEAAQTPVSPRDGRLWPEPCREIGFRLERAIADERWVEAVLVAEELTRTLAQRWAHITRYDGGDPVPAFLLLRGVSSDRYRTLTQAAMVARQGKTVVQSDAMAGLILALQSVW
jgi:signal recognition particle receptor subunit beta